MRRTGPHRRDFLVQSSAALAALGIGCGDNHRPNSRITVGVIGVGGFGASGYHLGYLLGSSRVEVVAVADPDATRVEAAVAATGNRATGYRDYRELLARSDLDAIVNVTPDHWHAKISIDAANAGKHVYCEKPLTLTIAEGRAMVSAARANLIAFQTGSQQRSVEEFQLACELVRNGRLGQLQSIEASIYGTPIMPAEPANPQPETLDWDLWLGPAPVVPYHQLRAAGTFRYFRDYGGGTITDLGAHELDIAQWGAGRDASGPTTISATATFAPDNFFESAIAFDARYTYADGVALRLYSSDENWHVRFTGSEGEVRVARGLLEASRPELLDYELGSGDVVLETSRDHFVNWFKAIEYGVTPICDVEIGHRSATLCHLANIAIETGRTLTWDPVLEQITGDADANALLSRPYREGW
jgi:predicted dehydrogenase